MGWTKPPIELREDWGALPYKSNPGGFTDIVATVCHYTAADKGYAVPVTGDHERCRNQVRSIQRQHQAITNQSDIEYNALTCNHGVLFQGRATGIKGGANGTAQSNATMPSICCLLGVDDQPSAQMLNAVGWFHANIEAQRGRTLDMKKHMEIVSTSCPGGPMSAWVDAEAFHMPPPDPTPDEEDDVKSLIRQRFLGYHNVWLVGVTPTHMTPETNAHYGLLGVPEVVVQPHHQSMKALLFQSGMTKADLVPNGEVDPWYL